MLEAWWSQSHHTRYVLPCRGYSPAVTVQSPSCWTMRRPKARIDCSSAPNWVCHRTRKQSSAGLKVPDSTMEAVPAARKCLLAVGRFSAKCARCKWRGDGKSVNFIIRMHTSIGHLRTPLFPRCWHGVSNQWWAVLLEWKMQWKSVVLQYSGVWSTRYDISYSVLGLIYCHVQVGNVVIPLLDRDLVTVPVSCFCAQFFATV